MDRLRIVDPWLHRLRDSCWQTSGWGFLRDCYFMRLNGANELTVFTAIESEAKITTNSILFLSTFEQIIIYTQV